MRAQELGKDPLTWSFVKLFGVHIHCNLRELEGLPSSHAWRWKTSGFWRSRLMTKAQCFGVVVSVVKRTDRVELQVDDGTALVKAVLWGEGVQAPVALGDLVHVEGKLNMDKNWDVIEPSRELRILRISKVEDPNEELLHWSQVMELEQKFHSSGGQHNDTAVVAGGIAQAGGPWEDIATEAFFSLTIDPNTKQKFLDQRDSDPRDDVLVATLEAILLQQRTNSSKEATSVTFRDQIAALESGKTTNGDALATNKNQRIRAVQYTFRKLRRAGLFYLEDDEADRHILLSFEAVMKPALLHVLQAHSLGLSIAEIADAILTQDRFKFVPLRWIEAGLEHLLASHRVAQREDSQLFFIKQKQFETK
ncbi:hypothetical protein P3T76_010018 [Phytophthora citrophthora]|uniref:CST complex subunit STN1 n=1 Tax=Phytophthora citrophthora TaxID=4793 RepID=A0AAD9GDU6_9STRA|nr:hypothetical protein P3T76_010018 [Phytophthora citrophthora]